jgi:hypothetical protein
MKRLIFIALTLTLVLGMVLIPSIAAAVSVPITIHKTIPPGGPIEDFTFEAWRDLNNNNDIDAGDSFQGQVVITGAGTGVINSGSYGKTIIREILIPGSAYEQQPNQIIQVLCPIEVTFNNDVQVQEVGEILILKEDPAGLALVGATFVITPDPKTGTGSLTVIDNGLNDELPLADGELLVTGCQVCIPVTVTETVAPDGYILDPTPQPAHVTTAGETVTLTFINEKPSPDICIEKLVDCNDDEVYLTRDTGYYGDTPSWYIKVWNCGEGPLLNVMVSDTNGMSWGPFDLLNPGDYWEVYYDGDPIFETTSNTAEAIAEDFFGDEVGPVYASATNVITPPSCGTVCAAQTQPGEYLFGGDQSNWFTYITYNKGDGTAGSPKTYPIYTGKTHLCGTLYVYDDGTHIFVNYVLTDMGDCTLGGLSEYHLQVNDTLNDLKKKIVNKGGNPVPGKCTYIGTLDPMQSETGWIECDSKKDDISDWSSPIYIFAHGVGCYYCP